MNVVNFILQLIGTILVLLGIILLFAAKSLRPILRRAMEVVGKRRYLWFVGIFGGLAAYGGEVNFLVNKIYNVSTFRDYIVAIRGAVVQGDAGNFFTLLNRGFHSAPLLMISYAILVLLIIALIYWLIFISQGTIIRLSGQVAMNKSATFIDAVSTTSGKLWEMVKVAVIFLLIGWGAWLILAGIPTLIYFLTGASAWTNVAQLGSYVSLAISFINLFLIQYALAALLLLGKPSVESIIYAWRLFRRNTLITLELALVLFAANLVILVVVAALLLFFFPVPSLGGLIATLAVLVLELGLMSAFSYVATVNLFVQLQSTAPESKIGQWTERIVNLATTEKKTA